MGKLPDRMCSQNPLPEAMRTSRLHALNITVNKFFSRTTKWYSLSSKHFFAVSLCQLEQIITPSTGYPLSLLRHVLLCFNKVYAFPGWYTLRNWMDIKFGCDDSWRTSSVTGSSSGTVLHSVPFHVHLLIKLCIANDRNQSSGGT